jgi:hypothetical protein
MARRGRARRKTARLGVDLGEKSGQIGEIFFATSVFSVLAVLGLD